MISTAISLYEAKKNSCFQVKSMPDIGLLENIGLRVGSVITIQNRYALGGPVLLRIEDAFAVALGKDIAAQITVREVAAL